MQSRYPKHLGADGSRRQPPPQAIDESQCKNEKAEIRTAQNTKG